MEQLLSEQFLDKYWELKSPLSHIGEFVFLRTYSRYLDDKKRREFWPEAVKRATEYNIRLGIEFKKRQSLPIDEKEEEKEARLLFDNLFNLRTFPSGRTLYMGGTEVVKHYPLSNYNCAFTNIENLMDFVDVFYLLMVGSGVGIRIAKEQVRRLPPIRYIPLESEYCQELRSITSKEEMEHTKVLIEEKNPFTAIIKVGDSKEGWCEALSIYFMLISEQEDDIAINQAWNNNLTAGSTDLLKNSQIRNRINKLVIDYSYVRPEGERLKRFGGRASGHDSIRQMFDKMNYIIEQRRDRRLKTIDILDFATIISENVVSGGVRRSALMTICDEDDEDIIEAKRNLYHMVEGNWIENAIISHRRTSNNSILCKERPSLSRIKEIINNIKINGEPGFINEEEAKRRKSTFAGCNPCGEVLLQSKQCCNLTTNNMNAFVEGSILRKEELKEVLKLSTRVALRMTLVEVELPEWNKVMQKDPIIGVSLTGMMDMVNKTHMDYRELASLLDELREVVHEEGRRYAQELQMAPPKLMTTIKPEGSLSTLPCVSSGIHYAHSSYYIRRIRIGASDPLYQMIDRQGSYQIQEENSRIDKNSAVRVIEFPIKAPKGKTKYEVGALEQLELYKLTMLHWSDHNTSITVHVRENEWDQVVQWVYDNFEFIVGISFIPWMEETYPLLPFEDITKEDYEERRKNIKPIDYALLASLDDAEEHELMDKECDTGACPI
ncbi:MAG: hypothetical protein WBI07_09280 [Mobilitalea sp.]